MPRRLERSIARALRDGAVSDDELTALVKDAKADDALSPDERQAIEALLATNGDRFDPKARRKAEAFLAGGTALPGTGPLPDPRLSWDTTDEVELRARPGGRLVVNGFHFDDVVQNELGDCFLLASLSALAAANPDALRDAITDHGDGTFTVRFFEKQRRGPPTPVEIRVDGDLPTKANGKLLYASGRSANELWPAIVEKAWATWKGGYSELSLGGYAGDALTALTGQPADIYNPIQELESRDLWKLLVEAHAEGRAMVTGTGALDKAGELAEGLVPMHIYTVVEVTEDNGEKRVTLRNPYGANEPGDDGRNDGIFTLTLREFRRCFEDVFLIAPAAAPA
jgi:hypothetical protein